MDLELGVRLFEPYDQGLGQGDLAHRRTVDPEGLFYRRGQVAEALPEFMAIPAIGRPLEQQPGRNQNPGRKVAQIKQQSHQRTIKLTSGMPYAPSCSIRP